eukprot:246634_1
MILLLIYILINKIECVVYKEVLASSNACYPSTTYTATIFNAPEDGTIVGIKAVHNSGSVHFGGGNPAENWGSSGFQVEFLKVTNAASWIGTLYYPQADTEGFTQSNFVSCGRGCVNNHYGLSPYTNADDEIIFMNPSYSVTTSDQFMFQTTEGCCLYTTADNSGTG